MVERLNRSLLQMLLCFVEKQHGWERNQHHDTWYPPQIEHVIISADPPVPEPIEQYPQPERQPPDPYVVCQVFWAMIDCSPVQ